MKGDFTRRTFRGRNHYDRVLFQQGRVWLDAEGNEAADIQAHRDRLTTRDAVGWHGAPVAEAGMGVVAADGTRPDRIPEGELFLSPGRYYVDGLLCENEEPVPLAAQPDLPGVALPSAEGRYIAYLDVWHEHVTALERPELREVALGGPDTTTRSRTIWQVRLLRSPDAEETTCDHVAPPWTPPGGVSTGRLRARAQAPTETPDPCLIPATAGYRRLENQLYRVEIHDGSGAAEGPTYVWSRDNGVVAARLVGIDGGNLTIDAPGRDERLGFAKGQWVEVSDTDRVRRGEPGFLAQLDDAVGTVLTVARWRGPAPAPADLGPVTVVRRWDSGGAVPVTAGWVDLEDGVQVEFAPQGSYRTGDYWLIPARTANLRGGSVDPDLAGDVEWPRDGGTPRFVPPDGVEHRYAAVALLDLEGREWTVVSDCRRLFPALTELVTMEYVSGDGQDVMPGDRVPNPLVVAVANGTEPVEGAWVHFAAVDADGRVAATTTGLEKAASGVDVQTGPDGEATCFWLPAADPARPSQRVNARLQGSGESRLGHRVAFHANLSVAGQVWYDPGACDLMTGVRTVQGALERVLAARSLTAFGGDGQGGAPGSTLPHPVEVLVRSDCGPVPGAVVRFTAGAGGGVLAKPGGPGASELDVPADERGVARCLWRLGPTDRVQLLTAELRPDSGPVTLPDRLTFTATVSTAESKPGLHVEGVFFTPTGRELRNDSVEDMAGGLMGGIAVVLDGPPAAALVEDKPVLALTLELPFPLTPAEQEVWGARVAGTRPVTLAGKVRPGEFGDRPAVLWSPSPDVPGLLGRLFQLLGEPGRDERVLCRVTLSGRAIAAAEDPQRLVNGLAVPRARPDGTTELMLPTVDDVRGADFTLWFWLVAQVNNLVVVPFRTGLLRLKTLRDALSLSLPRDQVTARLPKEVLLAPGETDLDAARRAADRGFRDRPDRRLVLVVDQRCGTAATAIRNAAGRLEVELELVRAADPVAAAQARVEAEEQLDGVLTDTATAAAFADLTGFAEPVPL